MDDVQIRNIFKSACEKRQHLVSCCGATGTECKGISHGRRLLDRLTAAKTDFLPLHLKPILNIGFGRIAVALQGAF